MLFLSGPKRACWYTNPRWRWQWFKIVINSMARTIFKAKTSPVNHAAPSAPAADASAYGRDLDTWPRSWMGLEKDLPPGEELVACLRPFIEHLASSSLSPKTIRRHVDNLWLLGGEIIRDLNYDPSRRKVAAQRLLRDAVGADGGPLIYNGSEEDQLSLDSTCRKLHRFLSQPQR
jgi:hypothetical protein